MPKQTEVVSLHFTYCEGTCDHSIIKPLNQFNNDYMVWLMLAAKYFRVPEGIISLNRNELSRGGRMGKTFDKKFVGQIGLLTGMGVLLPGSVGTVDAAVIAQSQGFTVTASPGEVTNPGVTSNSDNQSKTVTFNQFDPSLGTLTEIDLGLSSTLSGSLSVSGSNVESTDNSTATWDAAITLTTPNGTDFSDSQSVNVSCDFGLCTNSTSPSFTEISSTSILSSFPAGFIGTGTFNAVYALDLTVSVTNNFDGSPAASADGSGTWDPPADGLTVTYIYTPSATVPEPGTLALLGMGAMAGLGFGRKRAKENG